MWGSGDVIAHRKPSLQLNAIGDCLALATVMVVGRPFPGILFNSDT